MPTQNLIGKIIQGDCLEVLKTFEDNSVDAIVTDPPYDLTSMTKPRTDPIAVKGNDGKGNPFCRKQVGFMGKEWDGTGIAFKVELWKECLRVLKPGGHLLAFGGTRTYHRMAVAIEDAGFEIRDMLEWIYASGFPKSQNIALAMDKKFGFQGQRGVGGFNTGGLGEQNNRKARLYKGSTTDGSKQTGYTDAKSELAKQWEGFGTALKPAHEPIVMARKPLSCEEDIKKCGWCGGYWEKKHCVQCGADIQKKKPRPCTIVENVIKWGVGAIDIDGTRIPINNHLTGSDLYDRLEIELLNNKLCQSNLSHLFVENAGKKKFPEDTTRKIRNLFSVVGSVDMPTSEKILGKIVEDISKMDIGYSEEMLAESISISLNTYISGRNTTEEKNQEDMMSTTLTGNETTTEKKTSNSLQEANTSSSIGRFPANVICSDDALNDGEITKRRGNITQKEFKGGEYTVDFGQGSGYSECGKPYDSGSKSRYFDLDVWAEKYGLLQFPKASKRERNENLAGYVLKSNVSDKIVKEIKNLLSI